MLNEDSVNNYSSSISMLESIFFPAGGFEKTSQTGFIGVKTIEPVLLLNKLCGVLQNSKRFSSYSGHN